MKYLHSPYTNWQKVPKKYRPLLVKKVCLYGAESTGKTTLAMKLAAHYQTDWVPEMARDFLGDKKCVYEDMLPIAEIQTSEVLKKSFTANRLLVCDTDTIITQVYSDHYFGTTDAKIYDLQRLIHYDLYLVCDTDIPWVADAQRDLGHLREEMKQKFVHELNLRQIPFYWIRGNYEQRFESAVHLIESKIFNNV